MASKTKGMRIGKAGRSIPLEALGKAVKGVEFGHAKLEPVDEKAFEDFLDRLPKPLDIGAMFRMKGGK